MIPVLDLAQDDGVLAAKLGAAFPEMALCDREYMACRRKPFATLCTANAFSICRPNKRRLRGRGPTKPGYVGMARNVCAIGRQQTPPDYRNLLDRPFDLPTIPIYRPPAYRRSHRTVPAEPPSCSQRCARTAGDHHPRARFSASVSGAQPAGCYFVR